MRKRILPEHIPGTSRAWKQQKRREWKAVLKAMDVFRLGCAYTPAFSFRKVDGRHEAGPIHDVERSMKEVTDALSFKKWGR